MHVGQSNWCIGQLNTRRMEFHIYAPTLGYGLTEEVCLNGAQCVMYLLSNMLNQYGLHLMQNRSFIPITCRIVPPLGKRYPILTTRYLL